MWAREAAAEFAEEETRAMIFAWNKFSMGSRPGTPSSMDPQRSNIPVALSHCVKVSEHNP